MIELPEAISLANQLQSVLLNLTIEKVIANQTPHRLAWFTGDSEAYSLILTGQKIQKVMAMGGFIEIQMTTHEICFNDGIRLTWVEPGDELPLKHQLALIFNSGQALCAQVQMYGGLGLSSLGNNQNPYYLAAKGKPNPLNDEFSLTYYHTLIAATKPTVSLKAFLATEQRIPGLGNGVLQDILLEAGFHPKQKLRELSESQHEVLFKSIKKVLADITNQGGRSTEFDLYGKSCGYSVRLCKDTYNKPCVKCGDLIQKENFMGGSIYYCPTCQPGGERREPTN